MRKYRNTITVKIEILSNKKLLIEEIANAIEKSNLGFHMWEVGLYNDLHITKIKTKKNK